MVEFRAFDLRYYETGPQDWLFKVMLVKVLEDQSLSREYELARRITVGQIYSAAFIAVYRGLKKIRLA